MANTNLAVAVNNMIYGATEPLTPSQKLIEKLNVNFRDNTVVVDSLSDVIRDLNEYRPCLFEYIGELDFFNEVIGLACYCAENGMTVSDCRHDHHSGEYPMLAHISLVEYLPTFIGIDIVIDVHDMNVYRVHYR